MTTPKAAWTAAVYGHDFAGAEAGLGLTLTRIARVVRTDGTLPNIDALITAARRTSPRTMRYHLAWAVRHGWLCHEAKGGNGRRAAYHVLIPGESCRQHVADNLPELQATGCLQSAGVAGNPLVSNSTGVAGKLVASSIRHTASVSELGAVDQDRERRDDHNGARVSPDHAQEQLRIKEKP